MFRLFRAIFRLHLAGCACMHIYIYIYTHTHTHTWSDSKVMGLVPKRSFILFIHQLQCGHLQNTSLVPAHTFSSYATILCSIPGTQLVGCLLRPVLQPSGCLLLTQNVVISLPILIFEIKRIRKVRDQVSREAAASP